MYGRRLQPDSIARQLINHGRQNSLIWQPAEVGSYIEPLLAANGPHYGNPKGGSDGPNPCPYGTKADIRRVLIILLPHGSLVAVS
jgi:hypothetical protein